MSGDFFALTVVVVVVVVMRGAERLASPDSLVPSLVPLELIDSSSLVGSLDFCSFASLLFFSGEVGLASFFLAGLAVTFAPLLRGIENYD